MAKTMSPELKAAFRNRIRHIHLPDNPPLYTPRSLPGKIRDFLHSQIVGQRYVAKAIAGNEPNEATGDVVAAMRAWLRQASPPPTVLSFTRRPTYVLPKQYMKGREPWEVEYLTANLKIQQDVVFSQPPGWSPGPFRPISDTDTDEQTMRHNPLAHRWVPGVMVLPCAEPMYFGPGQISIWPVMDLLDDLQRGKTITTKHEYERILEDTTNQVLKREYGLDAFSIPGKSGVWVESFIPPPELTEVDPFGIRESDQTLPKKRQNTRRIATIHADFVDNITRYGVSIHVGQPAPELDVLGGLRNNPWVPIRQDKSTTSIVAELALKGSVPGRNDPEQQEIEHRSSRKSLYLQTAFDQESSYTSKPLQATPYSLVTLQPGLRQPTPMGLDNRDLSTAWTHEFARRLGLLGGIIDHLSMVDFSPEASSLPAKARNIGFKSRPVMGEDRLVTPYEQVEVPTIQLKKGGPVTKEILDSTLRSEIKDERIPANPSAESRALSWPLYYHNLTNFLAKSIAGLSWDTRLTQLVRSEKVKASIDRRWEAIREAEVLKGAWRNYQNPRSYDKNQSLPEALVADIKDTTQEMRSIAQSLQAGRINVPKKKLLAKTDDLQKLLEAQNIQAVGGLVNPTDQSPAETDSSLLLRELDDVLRSSKVVLEQMTGGTSIPGSKGESKAGARQTGQPRIQLTPTRAELRARKRAALEQVKAAKLGPPKPKTLHELLPTRRVMLKRISIENSLARARDLGEDTGKVTWLPSTGGADDKPDKLAAGTANAETVKLRSLSVTESVDTKTE